MTASDILSLIDAEIANLQQARALIAAADTNQNGRPKLVAKPKRTMSAEGRARIAAAQKKRWAALKKAAK